jgi:imidazoleglycerol phosphate synthase glutamine amidotransferase subunit HisH
MNIPHLGWSCLNEIDRNRINLRTPEKSLMYLLVSFVKVGLD